MSDIVSQYATLKKKMLETFGCNMDYYLRLELESSWKIIEEDEYVFLQYQMVGSQPKTAAVVKRKNKPLVYKHGKYTLIVAIDCVKIGFVFRNQNQTDKTARV